MTPSGAAVSLLELFKYALNVVVGDTGAGIGHGKHDHFILLPYANGDASITREARRVV
jgi:hypothetical protein